MVAQKQPTKKEAKSAVSFNRTDGRVQQLVLSDSFTLNKGIDTYTNREQKGYDTFPQRMNDIESTINGPVLGIYPIIELAHLGKLNSNDKGVSLNLLDNIIKSSKTNK